MLCVAIFDVCDSGSVTMLCSCQAVQAVSAFLDQCCGPDLVVVQVSVTSCETMSETGFMRTYYTAYLVEVLPADGAPSWLVRRRFRSALSVRLAFFSPSSFLFPFFFFPIFSFLSSSSSSLPVPPSPSSAFSSLRASACSPPLALSGWQDHTVP